MLLDKIAWVQHEGAIYSVHAQPGGARFATGGFDQKVKVWNLAAALDAQQEARPSTTRLLATLAEHTGAVNVVRFSHGSGGGSSDVSSSAAAGSGGSKLLASGSDDGMVIVYHLLPGMGSTVLGAGGAANAENWRAKLVLRGHAINISDLAWSHDDAKLATASMDCSVIVWDVAGGGHRLATLRAQKSFVKGVQWDPVGSYLAAQSDDHSVVVYQTSDWAPLVSIDKPYRKMITDTFATRLSFSPDGAVLLTGNSFQRGNHCAVLVPRGKWEQPAEFLFLSGHTGAVVSTAFCPKMFHRPVVGPDARNGKSATFEEALSTVFATAGTDKRVVVWTAGHERPVFSGKAFFKQGVTDLAWTSDGYALLACSGDGTVGVFQFTEEELGRSGSLQEMEEVMRELYGDRQRGVGGGLLFAESVDQLDEEHPAAQQAQQQAQQRQQQAAAEALGPSNRGAVPAAAPPAASKPAGTADSLTARLEGRMGAGGDTQVGFGAPSSGQQAGGAARSLPALMRGGDGRKRIVPEATGGTAAESSMPPPAPRPPAAAAASSGAAPAAKRQRQASPPIAAAGQLSSRAVGAASGAAARAPGAQAQPPAGPAGGAGPVHPAAAGAGSAVHLLQGPGLRPEWSVQFQGEEQQQQEQQAQLAQLGVAEAEGNAASPPRELRVVNRDRGPAGRPQAELLCVRGREQLWSDLVAGQVACAVGTPHFAAVGLLDGSVLLYSPAGRRLGGPVKLGASLARLACDGGWLLLAITTSGRVKLMHVGQQRTLLSASVAPLVEDGSQVVDARLSRQGWPMLTLSSHRAYLWHPGLEEWMCVAEGAYSGAPYVPTMRLQNQGELAGLQADVLAGSAAAQPRSLLAGRAAQAQQSRALLESNLAAALCLRSPQEYRRWLSAYAQLLAETGDEGRLRELCMELLGPPFAAAQLATDAEERGGAGADSSMPDAPSALVPAAPAAGAAAGAAGPAPWEPTLLGLDKREELLRGEVLRVVGRSRVLGGLAQEMRDILDDISQLGT